MLRSYSATHNPDEGKVSRIPPDTLKLLQSNQNSHLGRGPNLPRPLLVRSNSFKQLAAAMYLKLWSAPRRWSRSPSSWQATTRQAIVRGHASISRSSRSYRASRYSCTRRVEVSIVSQIPWWLLPSVTYRLVNRIIAMDHANCVVLSHGIKALAHRLAEFAERFALRSALPSQDGTSKAFCF